jgi:hypothetical protein
VQVNDISWSPYSSTIFAAVSVDGRVTIFDLREDIDIFLRKLILKKIYLCFLSFKDTVSRDGFGF